LVLLRVEPVSTDVVRDGCRTRGHGHSRPHRPASQHHGQCRRSGTGARQRAVGPGPAGCALSRWRARGACDSAGVMRCGSCVTLRDVTTSHRAWRVGH
jgi:hypothetical protein